MIKRFIITEEEKKRILNLYNLTYNIISESLILELGDGSAGTYDYTFLGSTTLLNPNDKTKVEFTTDSNLNYYVSLELKGNMHLFVDFNIIQINNKSYEDYPIVNRGEIFKVMSTISDVVIKVLESNPNIKGITYIPAEKENDLGEGRDRIYKLFIKNFLNKTGKDVVFDEKYYPNMGFKHVIMTFK
jgi:hypothetical protein